MAPRGRHRRHGGSASACRRFPRRTRRRSRARSPPFAERTDESRGRTEMTHRRCWRARASRSASPRHRGPASANHWVARNGHGHALVASPLAAWSSASSAIASSRATTRQRPLPPDAVDRMRMVAEVALEVDVAARDRESRMRDAVRVGNERIAGVGANIARGASVRRRRAQHVDAAEGEARDGAADLRRESTRAGPAARDSASVIVAVLWMNSSRGCCTDSRAASACPRQRAKGILPLLDAQVIYVI